MQKLQSTYISSSIGKIPSDWKLYRLQDISLKITDGTHKTPLYLDEGIPFLRVTDIHDNEINWNQVKRISVSEHQELVKRCKPDKGDILLSKNGTIGITKLVNWEKEFSIFVSLCLIKPNHSIINNEFLSRVLKSDLCLNQMGLRSKQGTVTNLYLEEYRYLLLV
jgi:type I restriction enzyme S subunit